LRIRGFRSCENVGIQFQRDLTVLVGENNGGKTNVIDAIRLLTTPLNGRRDRYPEEQDLRRGITPSQFEIVGRFDGLSDTLKGLLISAVPDPTKNEAIFGLRHEGPSTEAPRGRTSRWAGRFEATEPEPGSTDLIRHVYLPALRDAHQALGTGSAARVLALFRHYIPKAEEATFIEAVRRTGDAPAVLLTINSEVGSALEALTSGVRSQGAELGFASETLIDVARDLRFKLGDAGLSLEEVRSSGLLFGPRALLVEGIAEALLLPAIAQYIVLRDNAEAWRRFRGGVIVAIEGVDFRPYVEVLLKPCQGARIADRVVVITDGDPKVRGNRKADLEALAARHGAAAALHVNVNMRTLEHELFAAGNEALLKAAVLKLHRGSRHHWEQQIEGIPEQDRPDAFITMLEAKRTRKGDLAQEIAERIQRNEPFLVPTYLEQAIRRFVED
jgi:AAA ATPase domain